MTFENSLERKTFCFLFDKSANKFFDDFTDKKKNKTFW